MKRAETYLRFGDDDIAWLDLVVEQLIEERTSKTVAVGDSLPLATTWMPSGAAFIPCGLFETGT